jgi:hypothetical protein
MHCPHPVNFEIIFALTTFYLYSWLLPLLHNPPSWLLSLPSLSLSPLSLSLSLIPLSLPSLSLSLSLSLSPSLSCHYRQFMPQCSSSEWRSSAPSIPPFRPPPTNNCLVWHENPFLLFLCSSSSTQCILLPPPFLSREGFSPVGQITAKRLARTVRRLWCKTIVFWSQSAFVFVVVLPLHTAVASSDIINPLFLSP